MRDEAMVEASPHTPYNPFSLSSLQDRNESKLRCQPRQAIMVSTRHSLPALLIAMCLSLLAIPLCALAFAMLILSTVTHAHFLRMTAFISLGLFTAVIVAHVLWPSYDQHEARQRSTSPSSSSVS